MNKTSLIAAVAAYAAAIAVSFSIGFMLGPKQVPTGYGEPGVIASSGPASQGALVNSRLGNTARPSSM